AARTGHLQCGGDGALAAHARGPHERGRQVPHRQLRLRHLQRRRPDGRRCLRGVLAGGTSKAGEPDLPLRRQPDLARRPHRAHVHRGPRQPVTGVRRAGRIEEQKKGYEDWQRRFTEWQRANPQNTKLWSALADQRLPDDLPEQLAAAVATASADSTRKHGQAVIQKAAQLVPGLVGGSADLDPSTFTYLKDGGDVQPGSYGGRNIHFGVREHGMGAIVNGFAYDGFFVPYSATFLLFSDYMRPPMRLAAISKLHSVFVFTHDSIFLGEDGPTHQPIEQLAALRAIPNLELWRPADGVETA